jgi:hypothetical protein
MVGTTTNGLLKIPFAPNVILREVIRRERGLIPRSHRGDRDGLQPVFCTAAPKNFPFGVLVEDVAAGLLAVPGTVDVPRGAYVYHSIVLAGDDMLERENAQSGAKKGGRPHHGKSFEGEDRLQVQCKQPRLRYCVGSRGAVLLISSEAERRIICEHV